MSTVTITINTDNAAFGESEQEKAEEVARILSGIVKRLQAGSIPDGKLKDINGNTVGQVGVYE